MLDLMLELASPCSWPVRDDIRSPEPGQEIPLFRRQRQERGRQVAQTERASEVCTVLTMVPQQAAQLLVY